MSVILSQDDQQQTEPPLRANFSGTANQWIIHDEYVNYELQKELREDEFERGIRKNVGYQGFRRLLGQNTLEGKDEANKRLLRSAKILERMVNQESYKDIALGQ